MSPQEFYFVLLSWDIWQIYYVNCYGLWTSQYFFNLIFKKAIYNCVFLFCCICPYFLWWYSQINLIWGQGLWSSWVLVTNLISWSIFADLCMIVFEEWQCIYGRFQPFHPFGTPQSFHHCPSLPHKLTHILRAHLKTISLSKTCLLSFYG